MEQFHLFSCLSADEGPRARGPSGVECLRPGPLGMEDRAVKDNQISLTESLPRYPARSARLNGNDKWAPVRQVGIKEQRCVHEEYMLAVGETAKHQFTNDPKVQAQITIDKNTNIGGDIDHLRDRLIRAGGLRTTHNPVHHRQSDTSVTRVNFHQASVNTA